MAKNKKEATIIAAGSGKKFKTEIYPGTTPADILAKLGIEGHLRKFEEAKPFGALDDVYRAIEDGAILVGGTTMDVSSEE